MAVKFPLPLQTTLKILTTKSCLGVLDCNGRTKQQRRKAKADTVSHTYVLLHTLSSDTTMCSTVRLTTQCRTPDKRSEHLKSLQIHPPNPLVDKKISTLLVSATAAINRPIYNLFSLSLIKSWYKNWFRTLFSPSFYKG